MNYTFRVVLLMFSLLPDHNIPTLNAPEAGGHCFAAEEWTVNNILKGERDEFENAKYNILGRRNWWMGEPPFKVLRMATGSGRVLAITAASIGLLGVLEARMG